MLVCSLRSLLSRLPITALLFASACGGGEGGPSGVTESEAAITGLPLYPNYLVYSVSSGPIIVRDLTTTHETALPISGRYPVMSPDRQRIAFVSTSGRVTVSDADGTNVHTVSGVGFTKPAWSPDSTLLAYASEGTAGYGANIFVRPADLSGPQRQLTNNPGGQYFSPKFLSNAQVVFQRGLDGSASFALVNVSASLQSTFSIVGGMVGTHAGGIDPSPGGIEIVYEKANGSCGNSSIVVAALNYDGSGIPTASAHHEIYCEGTLNRDSHSPSWGAYGKISFERANVLGGRDAVTTGSSGSAPAVLQFSTTTQALDLSVR